MGDELNKWKKMSINIVVSLEIHHVFRESKDRMYMYTGVD